MERKNGARVLFPTPEEIVLRGGYARLVKKEEDGLEIYTVEMKLSRTPDEQRSLVAGINPDGKLYIGIAEDVPIEEGKFERTFEREATLSETIALARSAAINITEENEREHHQLLQTFSTLLQAAVNHRDNK